MNDIWDKRMIELARLVASWSKDQSTKCGCVIVGPDNEIRATGYNGLPRGMKYTPEVHERPGKYFVMEHSERNALYNAARVGVSVKDCRAYVTGPPCHDCARAMIQSGIKEVIIPELHNFRDKDVDERWRESCSKASEMMKLTGIIFRIAPGL